MFEFVWFYFRVEFKWKMKYVRRKWYCLQFERHTLNLFSLLISLKLNSLFIAYFKAYLIILIAYFTVHAIAYLIAYIIKH